MFKKIWSWVTSPVKNIKEFVNKRLVSSILSHIQDKAQESIKYEPLNNLVQKLIKRIEHIGGLLLDDNPDNKAQINHYIHHNKDQMLVDLMAFQWAILREEFIIDPKLNSLLERHKREIEEYRQSSGSN